MPGRGAALSGPVLRGLALFGLAGFVLVAWLAGWYEHLSQENLRALLTGSGPWGPVVFVLLFALLEPLYVPGVVFMAAASVTWSLPVAFLLSWAGAVGAGVVGFTFARTVGRDWVARHLPERFRHYDERLAEHGLRTVIVLRLLFGLAPPVHFLIGLSRVRIAPFLVGTALGLAPLVFGFVLVGASVLERIGDLPGGAWLAIGGLLASIVALRIWRRRRSAPASLA